MDVTSLPVGDGMNRPSSMGLALEKTGILPSQSDSHFFMPNPTKRKRKVS